MSELLASVIIPHYRSEESLNECIESLQRQELDLSRFEIIVVQNEDSPLTLKPELKNKIKVIYEPKPGSYRARNKGVEVAASELLFFTDADCRPSKDWISQGLEYLSNGHGIIGGHIELSFLDSSNLKSIELYEKVFYFNQNVTLTQDNYAATANLIVRKQAFHEIGPFDSSLMSGGDREWGRRAFKKGHHIHYAHDVIVFHPSRTKLLESLQRRIRIASNDLYIRMRKYGLSAEGKKELKKQLLAPPNSETWSANWEFFYTLDDNQKKKVLNYHRLFSRIDYLIVILGSFSFKALKILTKVDRLRLK